MGLFDDDLPPAPPKFEPSLADSLGLTGMIVGEGDLIAPDEPRFGKMPVRDSVDLARVCALPRRALPDAEPIRQTLIDLLAKPGCDREPFDSQVHMLVEAIQYEGGLFGAGVGHGKTWTSMVLPLVFPKCKTAVLFIPPNMRASFAREWKAESARWKLPNLGGGEYSEWITGRPVLHVIPYSLLSNTNSSTLLEELRPDLVIADEAHNLRSRDAVRTSRFLKYFEAHPETRLVAMSGTLTSRSIKDYAHLSEFALRRNSPLPLAWHTLDEWSTAIDPPRKGMWNAPAGALRKFCRVGETVREGFRRRLVDTPGVLATQEASVECSIQLRKRDVEIPHEIRQMLIDLRGADEELDDYTVQKGSWARPDKEELVTPMQVAECAREIASGFYYKWKYTKVHEIEGMDRRQVIEEWFAHRKEWNKELRKKVQRRKPNLDSPALCTKAAIRWEHGYKHPEDPEVRIPPYTQKGPLPTWEAETWPKWSAWHKKVEHETEAVWVSDFLAADAVEWAKKHGGIVWYHTEAFGQRVAELGNFAFYPGGDEASATIELEKGNRPIVASVSAHGTGKNLQYAFSSMLLAELPSSNKVLEQVIGRIHRPGQKADEIEVHIYQHVREAMDALDKATEEARYVFQTWGSQQKLLLASRDF